MAIIVNMLLVVLAVGCTIVASKPTLVNTLAELHRDVQLLKRGHESLKKEFKQIKSAVAAAILKSGSKSTLNIHYFQA